MLTVTGITTRLDVCWHLTEPDRPAEPWREADIDPHYDTKAIAEFEADDTRTNELSPGEEGPDVHPAGPCTEAACARCGENFDGNGDGWTHFANIEDARRNAEDQDWRVTATGATWGLVCPDCLHPEDVLAPTLADRDRYPGPGQLTLDLA